jgi:hypothetical protein
LVVALEVLFTRTDRVVRAVNWLADRYGRPVTFLGALLTLTWPDISFLNPMVRVAALALLTKLLFPHCWTNR